jgi:probable lipoprotein NlpC
MIAPPVRMAPWASDYVGIPFKAAGRDRAGLDCWGLVRLVYAEVFKLALPSYSDEYDSVKDAKAVRALIDGHLPEMPWHPVPAKDILPGDGLIFRVGGGPNHVGVAVSPDRFLHVNSGTTLSCIERLHSPLWDRRFIGAYRYAR